jgi:hypothetical protein
MNRSVPNLTWIVAWGLTFGILIYLYVGLYWLSLSTMVPPVLGR